MTPTAKHSNNLTARQRARAATEDNQRKLKARQKTLAKVFSALDTRDDATLAAGRALAELKQFGGTNAAIADEIGLDTREVSALLRHARRADTSDENIDTSDSDASDSDTPATDATPTEPDPRDSDEQNVPTTSGW